MAVRNCPSCNYTNPGSRSTCEICGLRMDQHHREGDIVHHKTRPGAYIQHATASGIRASQSRGKQQEKSHSGGRHKAKKNPVYPMSYHEQHAVTKTKMAVFDLDDTLFDVSQRMQKAHREGYISTLSQDASRKYQKGKASFTRFVEKPKNLRLDEPIHGTVNFINGLASKGYTVAYLSGRTVATHEITKEMLEDAGFPVFRDDRGDLLFLKPTIKGSTPEHKDKTMAQLTARYDVHYFFDDVASNLEVGKKHGIPGLYPSIAAYRTPGGQDIPDVHANPPMTTYESRDGLCGNCAGDLSAKGCHHLPGVRPLPPAATAPWNRKVAGGIGDWCGNCKGTLHAEGCHHLPGATPIRRPPDPPPRVGRKKLGATPVRWVANPVPSPKKKTIKGGKKRREKATVYFDRLMGKLEGEFPDDSQRAAVALDYVQKHYGKRGRDSVTKNWAKNNPFPIPHPNNPPLTETGRRLLAEDSNLKYAIADFEQAMVVKFSGNSNFFTLGQDYKRAEERLGPENVEQIEEEFLELWNSPEHSREMEIEREAEWQAEYNRLWGGVGQHVRVKQKKRPRDNPSPKKGDKAPKFFDQNLAYRYQPPKGTSGKGWRKREQPDSQYAEDDFRRYWEEANAPPRQNPNPKKVKKAKKAFDDFHGGNKDINVKKETIDVGDVWYSLGECWQIGYLSPKETGDDQQKYVHQMNEESKDGDFPRLYATMPDDGEPMLIIRGGSLRIEKRDNGVTWLVD